MEGIFVERILVGRIVEERIVVERIVVKRIFVERIVVERIVVARNLCGKNNCGKKSFPIISADLSLKPHLSHKRSRNFDNFRTILSSGVLTGCLWDIVGHLWNYLVALQSPCWGTCWNPC